MKIKFYGTRGSFPTPSIPERNFYTNKYGGHTTSLYLATDSDERFIIDAGSGMRLLGQDLISKGELSKGNDRIKILLTHLHQDHIEGIPGFFPFYNPKNEFDIYSREEPRRLEEILSARQGSGVFPVRYLKGDQNDEPVMMAKKFHHSINNKVVNGKNGTKVTYEFTNHPNGCIAYKFEENGKIFVFGGDHECGNDFIDCNLKRFFNNVNLLVMDAQYFPEETNPVKYNLKSVSKRGWGHSDYEQVVDFLLDIQPSTLVLTHHDPIHDDDKLDEMHDRLLVYARQMKLNSKIIIARDGLELNL